MSSSSIEDSPEYRKYEIAIKPFYKGRDSSHGWEHVKQVCKNALEICESENLTDKKKLNIIVIAALGHDIWDHKYIKPEDEETYKKQLRQTLIYLEFVVSEIDLIIRIIDSISFSKEFKLRKEGKQFNLKLEEMILRNIVSDADKLEALGEICIRRMIEYEINSKIEKLELSDHIKHIRKHCNEKLYLLLSDDYIKTDLGKRRATIYLQQMKEIVDNDKLLVEFIEKYLEERNHPSSSILLCNK